MERSNRVTPTDTTHSPLAIVGAGIGGLSLALLLAQRGIPSSLYEREETFSPMGNGLQLGPNVNAIFQQTLPEIDRAIALHAGEPDALRFYDGQSGKHLKSLPLGKEAVYRWGAPFRVIHRADLHSILLKAARKSTFITLYQGHTLKSVQQNGALIGLQFATKQGSKTAETPLLIGADGINSVVRKHLSLIPPQDAGQMAWRALIPAAQFPFQWGLHNTGLWMAPAMHLVHYPVRQGAWINVVLTAPETLTDIACQNTFGKDVNRIIAASQQWTSWPMRTHHPVFGKNNILLLGDASHAMLPHLAQGAAQAIEDAASLAALISNTSPLKDIATHYEKQRQQRVATLQKASASKGKVYRMKKLRWARNLILSLTPKILLMKSMDNIFKKSANKDK